MHKNNILTTLLRDTDYNLTLFSDSEIERFVNKVQIEKQPSNKPTLKINCVVRNKEIVLKPEEVIRQLYAEQLISKYHYPKKRIRFEHPIHFGRQVKKADIVIIDKDNPSIIYIIIEVKQPKLIEGKNQLKSYCNATGAPIAVWTNGTKISYYQRRDPNYFEEIPNIPKVDQSLDQILKKRFTWKDLVIQDKIPNQGKTLKELIRDMEDEVLANAGVDVFEEVFKLIFTKLFDEMESSNDKSITDYFINQKIEDGTYPEFSKVKKIVAEIDDSSFRDLEFRNTGEGIIELKKKIQGLFDRAREKLPGVFSTYSKIQLTPSHLSVCVSSLENVKLFNSNLQVIDEAFEYLISKSSKGEKGQYFTPRHVIDMCVKMLNPKKSEYMIDTAAGSCGFPVHTIFHITGRLFSNQEIPNDEKENILKIFGIDFDEKAVRVARTLNLIAGDGESNVLHLNTLDYDRWDEIAKGDDWQAAYGDGYRRLKKLRKEDGLNRDFLFDVLMANPPFAGDIKEPTIVHKYELGFKSNGKPYKKIGRDILFIERNLEFLRPGGRMAIVLPQGRFNNMSDQNIREFIQEHARIIAVVSLQENTFKPHTGTKTSVLFLQKWHKELCPKKDNYPIFFAVSENSGKDNSGNYILARHLDTGQPKLDRHGHLLVKHDLHNHGGELDNGIAEEFIQWAISENLSFWNT